MNEQSNSFGSSFPGVQNTQPIGVYTRPVESTVAQNDPKQQKVTKKIDKKTLFLISVIAVLVVAVAGMSYLYYTTSKKTQDPLAIANEESERIKAKVSSHILLPDEMPAIATIVDVDKLKADNPEFYANAENGDKILVYSNRAILYDPDTDKILNVAPILRTGTDTGVATETQDATTDDGPEVQGESTEEGSEE